MENHTSGKSERIAARVSREHKSLFEQAARMRGLSLTDFMTDSAYQEALRVLEQHQAVVHLHSESSANFIDALLNPRDPSELPALAKAFKKYKKHLED